MKKPLIDIKILISESLLVCRVPHKHEGTPTTCPKNEVKLYNRILDNNFIRWQQKEKQWKILLICNWLQLYNFTKVPWISINGFTTSLSFNFLVFIKWIEAAFHRCSYKNELWKYAEYLQENPHVKVRFQ